MIYYICNNYYLQLTFRSESFITKDWTKSLARLCHTCKTIKPYRASHCKACNRCVLAFDHHCPYIQNCVGYRNRPFFFLFVISSCSLQIVCARVVYICLSKAIDQYFLYPAVVGVFLFGLMTAILTFGAVCLIFIVQIHI